MADPSPFVHTGGELHLSNLGQLEMLRSMMQRGVAMRTSARGYSMLPFIHDGDILTIVPLGRRTPRLGEVVAFVHPGSRRLAIHRVVARLGDTWLICGDNTSQADSRVPHDDLLGVVERVQRGGRDVRLGLGKERRFIAILDRFHFMSFLMQVWYLPHRIAGRFRKHIQSH
jgi:hypothetical protein